MKRFIPHIPKRSLILVAGLVWLIAGINIFRIGEPNMTTHWKSPYLPLLGATVIFLLFYHLIFSRMVKKHSKRIMGYDGEKIMILRFFDLKSYIIMAFMMGLGIWLRSSNILKPLHLGVFYSGLGAALIAAGLFFIYHYFFNPDAAV